MKRFFCLGITIVMLITSVAFASPQTIDLETMSLEELTALSNAVQAAISPQHC